MAGSNGRTSRSAKQAQINQGDIVEVQAEGDGRIVLVRLERPKREKPKKAKITYQKGTHAVGSAGRPITSREVRELLKEM